MRFDGTLTTWHDDRGFGFISPTQGGQEIFVHITAFSRRGQRPRMGQVVSFELELGPQGKKRAKAVEPVRLARRRGNGQRGPAQWATASYFAIPAFLLAYLLAALFWKVPNWVAALYLATSLVAAMVYAFDKSAAGRGERRVPESTLLFIGLAGGWPGAIVAQQILRHKSSKASFRTAFWGSVVINGGVFLALACPWSRQLLASAVFPS